MEYIDSMERNITLAAEINQIISYQLQWLHGDELTGGMLNQHC